MLINLNKQNRKILKINPDSENEIMIKELDAIAWFLLQKF